jgi:hypothetical protein
MIVDSGNMGHGIKISGEDLSKLESSIVVRRAPGPGFSFG